MVRWHETLAARFGLRAAGLAGLWAAWSVAGTLYARVHSHPPAQASPADLGICVVLVLLLIAGNALLFVGAGLWKVVPVPDRGVQARIEPPVFEPLMGRETSLAEALRQALGERLRPGKSPASSRANIMKNYENSMFPRSSCSRYSTPL